MLILRVLFVVFALTQCSSSAPTGSVAPTLATIGGSQTRQPPPTPLVIRGTGQTAIQSFTLPAPISIARFTHDGRSVFRVESFVGGQGDLLINTTGPYDGSRPLFEGSPVQLNIEADGAWTVTITAITCCAASGEFAGHGDAVSGQFSPPARGPWKFSNSGQRTYVVYAHCVSGDQLVLNRVGPFQLSTIVMFGRGPCYWEVMSDGSWSIGPG